uniref:Uncharacterized protein n=1 Tax=Vibrio cholerae TaxID=666 RepID=O85208_VIBCL|nr:unknown [Vibrio cholerae]
MRRRSSRAACSNSGLWFHFDLCGCVGSSIVSKLLFRRFDSSLSKSNSSSMCSLESMPRASGERLFISAPSVTLSVMSLLSPSIVRLAFRFPLGSLLLLLLLTLNFTTDMIH